MRVLLADVRLGIASPSFALAALLVFASLMYAKEMPGASSAVSAFIYPISWNNVSSFLCIAAGVCSSADVVRDFSTRSCIYQISRTGKGRYLRCRFLSCFTTTFLAAASGFVAFVLVAVSESQAVVDPKDVESHYYSGAFTEFIYAGMPVLWFASVIVVVAVLCGILGCLGMALATFWQSRYVSIVLPFVLVFFWAKACVWLNLAPWVNVQSLLKVQPYVDGAGECLVLYLGIAAVFTLAVYALFRLGAKDLLRASL